MDQDTGQTKQHVTWLFWRWLNWIQIDRKSTGSPVSVCVFVWKGSGVGGKEGERGYTVRQVGAHSVKLIIKEQIGSTEQKQSL